MYKIIVVDNEGWVTMKGLPESTTVWEAHELLEPLRKQVVDSEIKSVEFWIDDKRISAVIAGTKGG